jgi:hypothetical protein
MGASGMCATLLLDGREIETQEQLAAVAAPLIYSDDAPDGARTGGNQCLCWVDLEKMAERQNWSLAFDGIDYVAKQLD